MILTAILAQGDAFIAFWSIAIVLGVVGGILFGLRLLWFAVTYWLCGVGKGAGD